MSRRAAAEAAVWVARLHGPDRSAAMEREFQAWLGACADHRHAFERCTDVWQQVPRLTLADAFGAGRRPRPTRWRWAVAALVAAVVAGSQLWPADDSYATEVGEYRQVVLADGSRLRLNTATRLKVKLGEHQREVEVQAGEAYFEVAKDPTRPFVVRAGGHQVRALGTVFTVRLVSSPAEAISVTLIEGQVAVTTAKPSQAPPSPVVLQPGQRLQVSGATAPPRLDRPPVEHAMAWTREEVVLDDMTLSEAVAEVNRYSRKPVVLARDPAVHALRVSGVYRAGDSEGFARAVAALHGLEVRPEGSRLMIQPAPAEAGRATGEDAPRARR